ncbi:uncharacterized protein LOC114356879 [Ostrinia furnacalis]|uniref:uncharacterized protein LOC114356879 n=1 Tax=Ostrinia furnacalis TaxID=93504 RepID=UPI00103A5D94|nr:uncharacterized protein LOC114356879 [Ostrinia furnacalis]
MLLLLITLFIPASLVVIFRFINAKHNQPIFGVYQVKNKYYWFKLIIMFIILKMRQLVAHIKHLMAIELGESSDGTIHIHNDEIRLEEKYFLGDNPKAIDGVYFNGMTRNGTAVICGIARRAGHVCDAFLYLKVENEELLLSPCLPDTYQVQTVHEAGEYKIQGLEIINYIPMRAWHVSYKGEMKLRSNPEKLVKVELQATWSARWSPFNYDTQMSALCMAKDIAREQWSRDYFKTLKKLHQTHYEQMGFLKGTVTIDGKEHTLNTPCVRDHSFGPFRDWKTFHRYVYHFIFLDNGDCMAIGIVSQPAILSHLTIGYVCRHSDGSVFPIQSCDFKLYQHGEGQVLPKDYGFLYKADGKISSVRVQVKDEETFYIGKDRVSKFYERWCDIEIDGVKGCACVEWQYNNVVK